MLSVVGKWLSLFIFFYGCCKQLSLFGGWYKKSHHEIEKGFHFVCKCGLHCSLCTFVKGEIQNRFHLISEERVKIFEHNSENLMKISWKIRKLWHFEVLWIFKNIFDQSIWICKWVSWWCHRLTIFHSFCAQKWQKFHISAMRVLNLP